MRRTETKGPITWWVSSRAEISARLTGLKFQTGFWNKSSENQVVHYMERDSARGAIQPGLKLLARYSQIGLGFSARPNGQKNPCNRYHFFSPGCKKEREHAYLLCFRTSVNFLTEIGVLRPGWNWPCNRNNISARWAERNFSPDWNSPCNQALSKVPGFQGQKWVVQSPTPTFQHMVLPL